MISGRLNCIKNTFAVNTSLSRIFMVSPEFQFQLILKFFSPLSRFPPSLSFSTTNPKMSNQTIGPCKIKFIFQSPNQAEGKSKGVGFARMHLKEQVRKKNYLTN